MGAVHCHGIRGELVASDKLLPTDHHEENYDFAQLDVDGNDDADNLNI